MRSPGVDEKLGIYGFIDAFHHELHEGEAYFSGAIFGTVADGANADVLLKTGGDETHFTYEGLSGGDAFLYFLESVVASTNGTSLPIYNCDRTITSTSPLLAFTGPTLTSTGTTLETFYLAGGQKTFSSGANSGSRREIILKKNTDYVIRINNRAGANKSAGISFSYYEH